MIARIRRSITSLTDADKYQRYLNCFVIPRCQSAEGIKGLYIFKECQGELVHFLVLSFWVTKEAMANYIGAEEDIVDPTIEEKSLLIAFEAIARHYEVTQTFEEILYEG